MERSYEALLALAMNEAAAIVKNKADVMDLPDDLTEWEEDMIRGMLKIEVSNMLARHAQYWLGRASGKKASTIDGLITIVNTAHRQDVNKHHEESRRLAAQPKQEGT